jgi:multiple sugar transport system substrate-binding protein
MPEKKTTLNRRQFLKASMAAAAGAALAATPIGSAAASTSYPVKRSKLARRQTEVTVMMGASELSDSEIEQFHAANPGITISRIDYDPVRFFAMLAAGEAPDLFRTDAPSLPQLLARRIPLNLQSYFESSSVLKLDDLTAANNYYKANSPTEIGSGPLYGMAKDASPDLTIWANKRLFEQAGVEFPSLDTPMSYEELLDLAQSLTVWDGDRLVSWGYGWETVWQERFWQVWLHAEGENLFSDDLKTCHLVDNAAARGTLQYMVDFGKSKAAISPINPTDSWAGGEFGNQRLSMMQYGFWFSGMIDTWANGDNPELAAAVEEGSIVMLPAPTWKGIRIDPSISATGMAINKDSKVKDEAWRVFEWYMGEDPAVNRAKSGWGIPALKSLFDLVPKEGVFRAPVWQVLEGELEYMDLTLPFNPYLQEGTMTGLFNQYWGEVMQGNMSFDEMLGLIEDETNFALEEGVERVED